MPRQGDEGPSIQSPTEELKKNNLRSAIDSHLRKLMSSSVVMRIHDISVHRIALPGSKGVPKEFFTGELVSVSVVNERMLLLSQDPTCRPNLAVAICDLA